MYFLGPPGPPGMPGPQGSGHGGGRSSCPQRRHYSGLESGKCPFLAESRRRLESHALIEEGTLVFLKEENKMVLKTSEGWVELQVWDFFPPSFLHLRLHHWENRSFITFFEQVQAMRFAPRTEETTTLSYRHTTGEEKIERLDIATTTTPRWQPRPPAPRLHELNKVSRILRPFQNQVPTLGFPLF